MDITAKLVADLSIILRGMRSHDGIVASHEAQAASEDVARHLRQVAAREKVVADRVTRSFRSLGAPAPRSGPSWLPSPTSLVGAAGTQAQPLGEALLLEASAVRMIADRARLVHGLAAAEDVRVVADVATQVSDLYYEYAGWLVDTASALTVNPNTSDLTPTTVQRLAGQVKVVVGGPAKLYGQLADRTAAGLGEATDRVRDLVGLGRDKLEDAAETVTDTAETVKDAVDDALTPVQASDLPVTRYDSRSAVEAAKAVRDLDDLDDVSTVVAYEAQHKDRKTVLDAGEKRVAELTGANA